VEGSSRALRSDMTLYIPNNGVHPIVKEASAFDLKDDTIFDLQLEAYIQVLGSGFTPKATGAKNADRAAKVAQEGKISVSMICRRRCGCIRAKKRHHTVRLLHCREVFPRA